MAVRGTPRTFASGPSTVWRKIGRSATQIWSHITMRMSERWVFRDFPATQLIPDMVSGFHLCPLVWRAEFLPKVSTSLAGIGGSSIWAFCLVPTMAGPPAISTRRDGMVAGLLPGRVQMLPTGRKPSAAVRSLKRRLEFAKLRSVTADKRGVPFITTRRATCMSSLLGWWSSAPTGLARRACC